MRHRASDLGLPVFDAAGYGGGFDLEAGPRYGVDPIVAPPPSPRRRGGHPLVVAGTATAALVGAALLVTGATQVVQRDQLTGLPAPLPGPAVIAAHQAPGPGSVVRLHQPPVVPVPPTTPSTTSVAPTPNPAAAAVRPAQGDQLPNTIKLPRGGTAYLVHVQVADDGSLPIPSGVDQAVWWGTGLNATAGATVFAGHVNWAGATGPFAELWQDKIGAVVTIRDNAGKQWLFRVTRLMTLNKKTLPEQAPALFSADGPHRIVLATCGGEWIGGALGYADNRVIVAVPIT